MRPDPVWTGEVSPGGMLRFDHPQAFEQFKRTLAGGRFTLRLAKRSVKRTREQNQFWWGVVIPTIAESVGYDAHEHDALHYALLQKCFGAACKGGIEVSKQPSSANLSVEQFTHLIDWTIRFAATDLGCVVPLPGEVL